MEDERRRLEMVRLAAEQLAQQEAEELDRMLEIEPPPPLPPPPLRKFLRRFSRARLKNGS